MPFFEKLGKVFRNEGQEERRISYLCGWVTRFGKFLKPKRYPEVTAGEVEAFVVALGKDGMEDWKVSQAGVALEAHSPLN